MKMWKDMTPEEKGALLLAYHEGKVIEYSVTGNIWVKSKPSWEDTLCYRIKPEPKRETITMYTGNPVGPWGWTADGCSEDRQYLITFDLIDGQPDVTSIKMEKL